MQYFNRTFFRFTIGFIGIILVSLLIIIATTAASEGGGTLCIFDCLATGK